MAYNLTGIGQNTTGFATMTESVNTVLLGGWLGAIFLVGILSIMFMAFMSATNDPNRAFAATCFVAFILSLLMWSINLLPSLGLFVFLLLSAGGLAVTWKSSA